MHQHTKLGRSLRVIQQQILEQLISFAKQYDMDVIYTEEDWPA
ncbi:MAG: hypothetical protein ACJ72T_08735 [Nitrososphaeraceae archaeon]